MRKIFSFNSELYKVTGVQKVLMDIHHAIKGVYDAKIVGTIPFDKVHQGNKVVSDEYIYWKKNPFVFYNSIVFVHERKYLIFFWLLNHVLFQKIKIIYVHHNIFHNNKLLSVMPQTVVSISDRSSENLINYFKVPSQHIHKIHNCVVDDKPAPHKGFANEKITLLYPARINTQKQQLEIVKALKGKIDKRITILFAGDGPFLNELKELVGDDKQFECLGYRDDVTQLLQKNDYILLYSKFEGLSITLLEATMCGVPIITNDVGGNLEIARKNENAFIANSWSELIDTLNNLPNISQERYLTMCKKSRDIYESNFNFGIFKKKYLELLENV